jgi:RecA/RadA recombinase
MCVCVYTAQAVVEVMGPAGQGAGTLSVEAIAKHPAEGSKSTTPIHLYQ